MVVWPKSRVISVLDRSLGAGENIAYGFCSVVDSDKPHCPLPAYKIDHRATNKATKRRPDCYHLRPNPILPPSFFWPENIHYDNPGHDESG